jgi:methionine biosynthesis protein MetW
MRFRNFYSNLWKTKETAQLNAPAQRDWFHRTILDRIFNPYANPRHQIAVSLLEGGRRLLDIGCWNGHLLELVRDSNKYQELYGIDIIQESVQATQSKGFQSQMVDLNDDLLPFADGFFDGVTILAVLEHVFEPYTVLRDVHRVLRPGGELVIEVPNVASFTNRFRILLGQLPVTSTDPGWDGGHLHYFTKRALDRFLHSEEFTIVARKTTGGHPRLREWWLSLLAGDLIYLCRKR